MNSFIFLWHDPPVSKESCFSALCFSIFNVHHCLEGFGTRGGGLHFLFFHFLHWFRLCWWWLRSTAPHASVHLSPTLLFFELFLQSFQLIFLENEGESIFDKKVINMQNQKKTTNSFWANDMWKSRFCKAYNLKYKKTYKTFYNKHDLYCQLVPTLEMTFALRELYGIEGGKGLILILDESMTYKVEQNFKTWSY